MIELDKLKSIGENIENQLIAIRDSVGAELGEFVTGAFTVDGKKVPSIVRPGKPISIGGQYYLVYIKDHNYHGFKSEHDRDVEKNSSHCFTRGNKVHFYGCQTLMNMKPHEREARYRFTPEISNSKIIDLRNAENVKTRLAWCKNCLKIFPGKGLWYILNKDIMAQNGDAKKLMAAVMAYDEKNKALGNKYAEEFRKHAQQGEKYAKPSG